MSDGYKIIRSKRKSVSMTVLKDGTVQVKAPVRRSKKFIDTFVRKNSDWIEAQRKKHAQNARQGRALTDDEIALLKLKAKEVMRQKTHFYEGIIGVECTGVKITSARTRWGSCSARNSVCYSYRTMLLEDDLQDYIVVHELCHIKQKNHSPAFYKEIEKVLPDYKLRQQRLKNFSNSDLY